MFIYQVSFEVGDDQMGGLEIGGAIDRALGYLRARLPDEPGFVTSRAMYSVDPREKTLVVFESVWERWDDVVGHRESSLLEDEVLTQFGRIIESEHLTHTIFAEVGLQTTTGVRQRGELRHPFRRA